MSILPIDCPVNVWTQVIDGEKQGRIRVITTNPAQYFYIVQPTGEAVPDNEDAGTRLDVEEWNFQYRQFVDIYFLTKQFDGKVIHDNDEPFTDVTVTNQIQTAFGELAVAEFSPQCGWSFNYNINEAIVKKVELFGGTVTQEGSFANLQTGTASNGHAVIRTHRSLVYTPGIGALSRFTAIFDTPQENSQQIIGIGNATDGWFFGYNGLQFGIMRRSNNIDDWIYQGNWSEDIKTGLNPQKGNVYQIKYQWLGFGMQYFGIENDEGDVENVHRIKYTNLNDDVSVRNPSLPLSAIVFNDGNTTNISLKTPSAVAGLQGEKFSPAFETLIAYERIQTIASGAEVYLFGLQNPAEWLTKDNRLYVLPKLFAAAAEGNKPIVFRVYGGVTITNPVWVDVSPDISPLQYDESGTFVLNGEAQVFTLPLGKADSDVVDLSIIDAEVQPDQIFAITAQSAGASDVIVGINFKSRT